MTPSCLPAISAITDRLEALARLLSLFLIMIFSSPVLLQAAPTTDKHIGSISCGGSSCHEADKPLPGSPITQNEYSIWKSKDEHAKAYQHLKNKLSKQIAKKLGFKKPAHETKICLDCHADNVPKAQQGKRFNIADGVACEACHGGARRWLGFHISGEDDHQFNLDKGLYPTEKPIYRAQLCLSCHFGNAEKFVTHDIMGAGHPRINFELATFTHLQPAHFKRDKDYIERKGYVDGTQDWAVGQAVAVGLLLDKLSAESQLDKAGLFPELSLFNCQACHHAMKNQRWSRQTRMHPGIVRINDANLILLRHAIKILGSAREQQFNNYLLELHQASVQGMQATLEATDALRKITRSLASEFAKHRFTRKEKRALLSSIIKEGISGRHADFMVAEQSLMALDAISKSLPLKLKLKPLYALLGGNPKVSSEDKASYTISNIEAYKKELRAIRLR